MKPSPALTNARRDILELPSALRDSLTMGRPEFESLIRRTRWGEGPLFMIGAGTSAVAAQAGRRAFEAYLGQAVIAREVVDFRAYSLFTVQPRSVLLVISADGCGNEVLQVAQAARKRGATVLALTAAPRSELAGIADGLFLVRSGQEDRPDSTKAIVCQQTVLEYLSLLSACILKRPDTQTEGVLREFESIPQQVDWVLHQLRDAICSFASEWKSVTRAYVTGAGFYYDAARQCTYLLRDLAGKSLEVVDPLRFGGPVALPKKDSAIVLISGSRCRLKRRVHEIAELCRKAALPVFSITDGNDRELVDRSGLAILLPTLSEMPGSILTLIVLSSAAVEGTLQR